MLRVDTKGSISPGILALAIFAGLVWTDATFKLWAQETLLEPVHITSWFCLMLQHNTGLFLGTVPLSSVSTIHWIFLCGAVVALGWRMVRTRDLAIGSGYALVAGGVMGNAMDRVNGVVVDFLGIGPLVDDKWVFLNIADVAMMGGLVLLGVVLVRGRVRRQAARSA